MVSQLKTLAFKFARDFGITFGLGAGLVYDKFQEGDVKLGSSALVSLVFASATRAVSLATPSVLALVSSLMGKLSARLQRGA